MALANKLALFAICLCVLLVLPPVAAFGAGNIASISKIEGKNFRHGDIEDTLEKIAYLKGHHKWPAHMIKRVYFGNWLRDYSQAVDVGSLKGVQKDSIRIIVWVLAFMGFGYATREFEVTEDRLGTYQAHEHIDNPKGYRECFGKTETQLIGTADDAQKYDPRLRPPVDPIEYAVDPNTGMKNYIANDTGEWATSSDYIRFSLRRSIHFGRMYTSGHQKGREDDLFEALRCLGQCLHTFEDFSAHSNYVELVLRDMGYNRVFPHVGVATELTVRGHKIFPLVTGTFGGLDFVISVLGEAGDHVASSEVDEVNTALYDAVLQNKRGMGPASLGGLTDALSRVPGTDNFIQQARELQAESDVQYEAMRASDAETGAAGPAFMAPSPGAPTDPSIPKPPAGIPGLKLDPQATIKKIYPILVFHDNIMRFIHGILEKIPGLEKLIEAITDRITLFVMSLIAPFVIPIIKAVSKTLKTGNHAVVNSSANSQYEVWNDMYCSDPTHSMLSKDHFSNILNEPAGLVASEVLKYVVPRVVFAWEHPGVPVDEILADVLRVFHHPALRNRNIEIQNRMYVTVEQWTRNRPGGSGDLNDLLSSESVKAGRNHKSVDGDNPHSGGCGGGFGSILQGSGWNSKMSGSPFAIFQKSREMNFEEELPDTTVPQGDWQQSAPQYGQPSPSAYNQPPAQSPSYGPPPGQSPYGQPQGPPFGSPQYGQQPYQQPQFQQPYQGYQQPYEQQYSSQLPPQGPEGFGYSGGQQYQQPYGQDQTYSSYPPQGQYGQPPPPGQPSYPPQGGPPYGRY